MKEVSFIVKKAKSLGACDILPDNATLKDLSDLLWHPQGQEFMRKKKFPTLNSIRKLKSEGFNAVVVDGGDVTSYYKQTAVAGDTHLTLKASGTKDIYDVVLFHGANMIVEASNYAAVE